MLPNKDLGGKKEEEEEERCILDRITRSVSTSFVYNMPNVSIFTGHATCYFFGSCSWTFNMHVHHHMLRYLVC